MPRFDYHFSYWIIVWCIIGTLTNFSLLPFYGLLLTILVQFIKFTSNIHLLDNDTIIIQVFVLIIMKCIPSIIIYNFYQNKICLSKEIPILSLLIILFICWKYILNNYKPFMEELNNSFNYNTPLVSIWKRYKKNDKYNKQINIKKHVINY